MLKKGEARARGCTAEQRSCTNPGKVRVAERAPPPTVCSTFEHKDGPPCLSKNDRRGETVRP